METLAQRLRAARRSLGLTLAELSARTGIPQHSIKAYESSRRHPPRRRMEAIVASLDLDIRGRNELMVAAGYAPTITRERLSISLNEAAAIVQARPWPAAVVSETIEIRAANDAFMILWDITPDQLHDPIDRNVLALSTAPTIAARCHNWDEAVGGIIAVFKGHRGDEESLASPSPYFRAILDRINEGSPELVRRFMDLWERVPPIVPDRTAWDYAITWEVPGAGVMDFNCLVNFVNHDDSLDIDDWVPADARSHGLLEKMLRRTRRRSGR